ncbi:MAG: class II fructose-bisphosphate aldolase [Candidatus Methanospirareceae archaeon]
MDGKPHDIEQSVMDIIMTGAVETKKRLAKRIFDIAYKRGIFPASIHEFYMARGRGELSGFTVPAINLRSMTYDLACALFRVARRNDCGAFIFEIARSEIGYTAQPPIEYAAVVLAAAIAEGYTGPVFIQGDHFQVNANNYKTNPNNEVASLQALIAEAIGAGFYNIDIDSSTLVDLSRPIIKDQQKDNYDVCAQLTQFIRSIQPRGVTVSVGGEIGEVGLQNSSPEELHAFMAGYNESMSQGLPGISKISVQTGTSHGGVVLPDGSIAQVELDFNTLTTLSEIARKEYGLAGAVQHGASTLPAEAFHKFPECETAEVHLATEFQNMLYESKHFPTELRAKMYEWLRTTAAHGAMVGETEEQYLYKTRKKALGPFKKEIMNLPRDVRDAIAAEIEVKFEFLFKQLNAVNNKELVNKYVVDFKQV